MKRKKYRKKERDKEGKEIHRGVKPPITHLPYPHGPTRKDKQRQFIRFLDMIKRLQINVPFTKAMDQILTYAKFMKNFLTKNMRIHEDEIVKVEDECNAII